MLSKCFAPIVYLGSSIKWNPHGRLLMRSPTWETSSAPPKEGLLHEFPEERHEAAQVLGYFHIEKAPEK